ncbi:MAG: hypothetical protein GXO81_10095, partial [Chlorobi bacterium]|nr:hypothetical protein [Chlorobiota bacterium]
MKKITNNSLSLYIILLISVFSLDVSSQVPGDIKIVRPKEIDDVLINPGIGFTTFQMFNGDNH